MKVKLTLFLTVMPSDDDVPRTITDIFHRIVQLGNRIRNKIASWKNTFMSVRRRRKRLFEARECLVLLKDALDRKNHTLHDERDIIDYEQHVARFKILSGNFISVDASKPLPLDITVQTSSTNSETQDYSKALPDVSMPIALLGSGSLSTIVFTESSLNENKQLNLQAEGVCARLERDKVEEGKNCQEEKNIKGITSARSDGKVLSFELSIDEFRSSSPETAVAIPILIGRNKDKSAQGAISMEPVGEKKSPKISSRNLKIHFELVENEN